MKKQIISDIEDSNIQQAENITNNYMIVGDNTLYDIIRKVVRSEFNIVTEEAYKKFDQIIEEFRNRFIDELSKIKNSQEAINKFKKPKYQFILHDTIKEYSQSDNKETKEELIDMLLERLQIDEDITEQFVIDDARHIIPRLSIASVSFLGAMLSRKIVYANHPQLLSINLKKHAMIFEHLEEVTRLDIAYLQQLGCITSMGLSFNVTIEEEMKRKYDIFFRKAPTIEKYTELISQYPQIKDLDLVHIDLDKQFGFQKVSTNAYEEELRKKRNEHSGSCNK